MKTARQKMSLTYKGNTDQVCSRPIYRNLAGQKRVEGYTECAESEKYATKNYLSSKDVIDNRKGDKKFPDKQKLKECVTTKPGLQEILRGTLRGKKMNE